MSQVVPTFCTSLRSRNAHGHLGRKLLREPAHSNAQTRTRTLNEPGRYTYHKNPSVWTHLGKKSPNHQTPWLGLQCIRRALFVSQLLVDQHRLSAEHFRSAAFGCGVPKETHWKESLQRVLKTSKKPTIRYHQIPIKSHLQHQSFARSGSPSRLLHLGSCTQHLRKVLAVNFDPPKERDLFQVRMRRPWVCLKKGCTLVTSMGYGENYGKMMIKSIQCGE